MPTRNLPALYKHHDICLWVEDNLTRSYLEALWDGDTAVGLYVSGGSEGTRAVVEMAWRDRHLKVFGLVDRDFGTSNSDQWIRPPDALRCYRGQALEVENFLLDCDALSESQYNSRGRTAEEIRLHMKACADHLTWWMACRKTLAELQRAVTAGFPRTPTHRPPPDRSAALTHILDSDWYTSTLPMSTQRWTHTQVEATLDSHRVNYQKAIREDRWQPEFSGKEIFVSACEYISAMGIPREQHEDVAKDVAMYQRQHQTVPAELTELRTSLYCRVLARLPPSP